ncbi:M24 family metallopeptidase [Paracoccus sp. (in: a-proteobacteria)]|uniref:M24 family metallopeptidase n=1 Tax=Paracoccus sp. TaxID=267 RepID=UPI003A8A181E
MTNKATETRIARLRDSLRQTGNDMIVLGTGPHMRWLLGFQPHGDERFLALLVTQADAVFVMPALEAPASGQHTDLPMFKWKDADGPGDALAQALTAVGGADARAVVIDETMRADFALTVLDLLPGMRRSFTDATIGRLRMCKDAGELAALKESARLDDQAMRAAFAAIRPGMTESDLAQVVRDCFGRAGAEPLFTIVGTGGNGAFPHHHTGDTVLKRGDAVVIDIGARLNGMPSDITRMAVVGDKPEGYDEIHAIVEGAVQAAMAAARIGARAHEVDAAARNHIAAHGYGDCFTHRTGHGLGVEVHEPPYISGSSQTVLEEGMVFSIEPGIYLEGRFGLRLEDIVYMTADGPVRLSELPRDVFVAGT